MSSDVPPASRQEALATGARRYFTGKPCYKGHVDFRRVKDSICVQCAKEKYLASQERNIARLREYRKAFPERVQERLRTYYENNRPKFYALNQIRRAICRKAQPAWVDTKALSKIYAECLDLSARTGIKYHVDHIIPLKGKGVCGLHVPWNLQIIEARENLSKGAKYQSEGVSF